MELRRYFVHLSWTTDTKDDLLTSSRRTTCCFCFDGCVISRERNSITTTRACLILCFPTSNMYCASVGGYSLRFEPPSPPNRNRFMRSVLSKWVSNLRFLTVTLQGNCGAFSTQSVYEISTTPLTC